jgi:Fe-S-cluster containining protein
MNKTGVISKSKIRGICKSCKIGSCCQEGVSVDLEEAMKISKLNLRLRKPWFRGLERDRDMPSGWAFSTVVSEGRCIFQKKDKRCRIYPYRPQYCREFPFENRAIAEFYGYLCKETTQFKRKVKKHFKEFATIGSSK